MHISRILFALFLAAAAVGARAQSYPTKPVRLVVPLAAGGPTDILARTVSQNISESWGQPVVVDNRPGANTNIGTTAVAQSAPDGYTLLLTVNNLTINPSFYPNPGFDPLKDFAPVSLFATSPLILMVNPGLGVKSVPELIALAKAKPGEIAFGSPGNGSAPHLAGELLNTLAGVKLLHVPYKGITGAMTDLIGGRLGVMFAGSPLALPNAKAGKVIALATTGAKRSPAAPELPTLAEAGLPNYELSLWYGLLAPAGTPQPVIQRLHDEIARIISLPAVTKQWAALGAEPVSTTPEQFDAFLKDDIGRWKKVIHESGAKMD